MADAAAKIAVGVYVTTLAVMILGFTGSFLYVAYEIVRENLWLLVAVPSAITFFYLAGHGLEKMGVFDDIEEFKDSGS